VTNLRKRMLEELQRRNYSESTIRGYLQAVEQFAKHFGKSPDKLGPDELRSYQAYLLTERKLAVGSVVARVAALRFFFVRTLKRREFWEELPYPKDSKDRRRLPTGLSLDEVARLIDAAGETRGKHGQALTRSRKNPLLFDFAAYDYGGPDRL
jgi:integrase/recombinase XerD